MSRMLEVLDQIRELEADLEREVAAAQKRWHYKVESGKVRFEAEVRRRHRQTKTSILRYLRESYLPSALSAPIVYSVALPFMLLDLWVSLYQRICFPIYGIPRVRRADYIVIDRWKLAYLNTIEKANCDYCSYANGAARLRARGDGPNRTVLVPNQTRTTNSRATFALSAFCGLRRCGGV